MLIKKIFQGTMPENKIVNISSTSQTDAYSCDYINKVERGIIETITNNNGTALKFPDGTMICYGSNTGTNNSYTTVTLAVPFINNNYRVGLSVVAADVGYVRTVQIKEKTASTMTCYLTWAEIKNPSQSGWGADVFEYIAIGRWK